MKHQGEEYGWFIGHTFPVLRALKDIAIFDLRGADQDVLLTATTCVGLINRDQPQVYLMSGDDDEFWLRQVLQEVPQKRASRTGADALFALLDTYQERIDGGLIIYDPALPDTINVATTLAGVRDSLVVSPELAQRLLQSYSWLAVVMDLRTFHWKTRLQAYRWAWQEVMPATTSRAIAGLNPRTTCQLRSFLVATKTFVYWLDARLRVPDLYAERDLMRQLFASLQPDALHLGWFINEPSGVALTSARGMMVLASDYFANLEIWLAYQPVRIAQSLFPLQSDGVNVGDDVYISFTMSDGDNLQYCQHRMRTLWQGTARGTIPIGWTIAPILQEVAPALANYYIQSASANDELIAGPDGVGYFFPSYLPEERLEAILHQTGALMRTMGLTTLEVLDADPCYCSGLPLLSLISLNGMACTNMERLTVFVRVLSAYGVEGLLNGAGFLLKPAGWRMVADLPLYQNLGLADTVDRTVALITRAVATKKERPLFLNVYVMAWTMSPGQLQQVVQRLDPAYKIVLPRTLLALLAQQARVPKA
ncbi:MAG TPA: GxGYxYP domain-containing protein [Dictyobacter sp.]|jgi:hypothetical protein|nr:GxGYxYP domain-containing protein [Dictyobacter sp.]